MISSFCIAIIFRQLQQTMYCVPELYQNSSTCLWTITNFKLLLISNNNISFVALQVSVLSHLVAAFSAKCLLSTSLPPLASSLPLSFRSFLQLVLGWQQFLVEVDGKTVIFRIVRSRRLLSVCFLIWNHPCWIVWHLQIWQLLRAMIITILYPLSKRALVHKIPLCSVIIG